MKNKKKKISIIVISSILILLMTCTVFVFSVSDDRNYISTSKYDISCEIRGEVKYPAIYTLPTGATIRNLVNLSGGFLYENEKYNVNLDTVLEDGMIVNIKHVTSDSLLNINTASIKDFEMLEGIGSAKAKNIVNYRASEGSFKSIDDIKKVSGISENIFNKIKDSITV